MNFDKYTLIQFEIQSKFLLSTSPTLVKAGRSVGPDQQPDRRARAAYTGSLLDLSCQDPHHHVQEVQEVQDREQPGGGAGDLLGLVFGLIFAF